MPLCCWFSCWSRQVNVRRENMWEMTFFFVFWNLMKSSLSLWNTLKWHQCIAHVTGICIKINFTSPNEESLLWPSASISSVNSESSFNRTIYCEQYVYQIPISYSLQRGGHIEHLCLWLILIGRAWPWQSWEIQKFHAKSSVQIHYSALKSNIGSGNKL